MSCISKGQCGSVGAFWDGSVPFSISILLNFLRIFQDGGEISNASDDRSVLFQTSVVSLSIGSLKPRVDHLKLLAGNLHRSDLLILVFGSSLDPRDNKMRVTVVIGRTGNYHTYGRLIFSI